MLTKCVVLDAQAKALGVALSSCVRVKSDSFIEENGV